MNKKKVSIVIPTYNEDKNINDLYMAILQEMEKSNLEVEYEIVFIDNNSIDRTQKIIREICNIDKKVKAIFNYKNYGHIRSPYHGLLQAEGDAIVCIAADFQDPIYLIPRLISKWLLGSKIVLLKRSESESNFILEKVKGFYYKFLNIISDIFLESKVTGSGIYDKSVQVQLKKLDDPYPYLRGLISEIYGKVETLDFVQPDRRAGITKNNFYTLYDMGMLAIVKHSKKLLRFMTISGFLFGLFSFFIGLFFFIYKILFWDSFTLGLAPIILGVTFGFSVQVFMIGILGEYAGIILEHTRKIPHVIEKERINF